MLSNNNHWPCLYAEWEKLVERRRLKAQEKENNLENRVIQEAGWDGARIQALDRKRDARSLKWRDGVRMSRKEDRFEKEGVSSWGSLLGQPQIYLWREWDYLLYLAGGEEGGQAEGDSQDLQNSSQGLYRAVTQSTNSGTTLSLGLNSVSATS